MKEKEITCINPCVKVNATEIQCYHLSMEVCYCVFCVCVCVGPVVDPRKVLIIAGHHNWIVAAYAHFVICYR